ncbi:MAG: hypothetical protein WC919_04585 [Candidatus Paceibacterota bacterium]|jgi:hypothetical protein
MRARDVCAQMMYLRANDVLARKHNDALARKHNDALARIIMTLFFCNQQT